MKKLLIILPTFLSLPLMGQTPDVERIGRLENEVEFLSDKVSELQTVLIILLAVVVAFLFAMMFIMFRLKPQEDEGEELLKAVFQPRYGGDGEQDHSLVLKVADEIIRIEINLAKMDPAVKGYKQLSKAVERIRTNFAANGYEIVDMLGQPYHEGMKVVANFVTDESLAEGAQIITGITKPQINYNGVMIQSAQITVSQNI